MSLIGALGPLGKVASTRRLFASHFVAYFVAGALASAAVGGMVAVTGRVFVGGPAAGSIALALIVVVLAITREAGWLSLPLPQARRQTHGSWAMKFSSQLASALWGLHVGLVFTTWLTFAGIWGLTAIVFVVGDVAFGTSLFLLYWSGRALSVWIAPLALRTSNEVPQLVTALFTEHAMFRRTHVIGLAWILVSALFWWRHLLGIN